MPRTIEEELRDIIGNNVLEIVNLRITISQLEHNLALQGIELVKVQEKLREYEQSNQTHSTVPKTIKSDNKFK